jgi:DNA-binding GntR family transcriptional regulator
MPKKSPNTSEPVKTDNVAGKLSTTLSDVAYCELRTDLIFAKYPPGSKLRIEQLASDYGVGATPLREALNRLAAEGFVASTGQRGFRVTEMSLEDLNDLTALRINLDSVALRQSVLSGDDEWEARVVAAFYRLTKVETSQFRTPLDWELRNREFHAALASACKSKRLHRFCDILYDQHKRYRNLSLSDNSKTRELHAEHTAIYEAALARDVEKAVAANALHITRTAEVAAAILQTRQ